MLHQEQSSTKLMSVEDAATLIGIGRQAAYAAAKKGEIPTLRIGRRIFVVRKALEDLLNGATSQG